MYLLPKMNIIMHHKHTEKQILKIKIYKTVIYTVSTNIKENTKAHVLTVCTYYRKQLTFKDIERINEWERTFVKATFYFLEEKKTLASSAEHWLDTRCLQWYFSEYLKKKISPLVDSMSLWTSIILAGVH